MSEKNDNKEDILKEIRLKIRTFNKLPKKFQEDNDIIIECIKNGNCSLIEKWKNDEQIAEGVLKDKGIWFEFFGKAIKNNKKIVLSMVKENGLNLLYVSKRMRCNKEVVFEAVKQNGKSLMYANDDFLKDRVIVLEAVKNYGWIFLNLKNELENDREIALEAVRYDGRLFFNLSEDFQKDKDFLEALALAKIKEWNNCDKDVFSEKMEILNSLREKELMINSIIISSKLAKKNKF